ncbi:N-acetyltransferase [Paraburkholderia fungorum]|uniref:GNAT family N-acetyltransferase n=1 Tax=Paraburkholderia fungorum TaxID=134537 RepID=UPI0038B72712
MREMDQSVKGVVSYRAAREQDVDAIVWLVNAAYRPIAGMAGWTHEGAMIDGPRIASSLVFDTLLAPDSALIVAQAEREIVGCVEVRADGDEAYIGTLAVSPAMQDCGLGKALLSEAERFANRRWNIAKAVMVVLSAREELIDFYLRRGYVRTGEVMSYPVDAGVGIPRDEGLTVEKLVKSIGPGEAGS